MYKLEVDRRLEDDKHPECNAVPIALFENVHNYALYRCINALLRSLWLYLFHYLAKLQQNTVAVNVLFFNHEKIGNKRSILAAKTL